MLNKLILLSWRGFELDNWILDVRCWILRTFPFVGLGGNRKTFNQLTVYMRYIFSFIIMICCTIVCIAQTTTFSLANNQTGINHLYFNIPSEMGSGVAFFNFNNDHYEDLVFTGGDGSDIIYKNKGNGAFEKMTNTGLSKPSGDRSLGVVTGDIDNDGDDDIVVLMEKGLTNRLYLNNGDETFTDITTSSGIDLIFDGSLEDQQSYSAAMGDVNQDGFLDIYITNWIDQQQFIFDSTNALVGFAHTGGANRLYINNGDLTFSEEADKYGVQDLGCTLAAVFSDPDNDQDADILVANDFGMWVLPDAFYQNQYPLDTFFDKSATANFDSQIYGMCVGVGDYDQDGDLDYYKTSIGRNVLLNNLGNSQFRDTTAFAQVEDTYINGQPPHLAAGWGSGFADIDHDTHLDLIVANGRVGNANLFPAIDSLPDRLFQNQGDGTFVDIASSANLLNYGLSRGMAYGDYDNDGDIDIIFTNVANLNLQIPSYPSIFKNNSQFPNRNWLKVKLEGTTINRNAIGSHIVIKVGGKSWVHEINSGGQGHTSQHSRVAHFGLGSATVVDSLIVKWSNPSVPDQVYVNMDINQMIKIIEGQQQHEVVHWAVNTTEVAKPSISQFSVFPNPVSDKLHIHYELTSSDNITILIINGLGQVVKQFPSQRQSAGLHQFTWDGAAEMGTGIYYVILKNSKGEISEQMVLKW